MVLSLMTGVKILFRRLTSSAVIWSWAFNGLRLASGIFLLPLLLSKLSKPEFGMYYLFLSIIGLLPIIDFGFSAAIGRFISYAMAGATTLQAQGFVPSAGSSGEPNSRLLWQLLRTTRVLYRGLALIGLIVMGGWGTFLVQSKVAETPFPGFTWLAWALTLFAATLDVYSNWWNTFLYCMNRVQESARILFFSYGLRIGVACLLLLAGAGLLSVPAASILGCMVNRFFSRRRCLEVLGMVPPAADALSQSSLLHLLWPNSWRTGLQLFSGYLRSNANTAICVSAFGLSATAEYGLSVQVMGIAMGMASVWTSVKWPVVGQYRSAQNLAALRALLWSRSWLQVLTFVVLGSGAVLLGPTVLKWFSAEKQMLPSNWLWLLAFVSLLDLGFVFWGTLLAAENRIPTLWATVATNVASLGLALVFTHFTGMGVLGLILAPLISGLVFNYWYWPLAGARSMGTSWWRFTFTKPTTHRPTV